MNRTLITVATVLGISAISQAVVVTQWNFNSISPDANTATGTLTPVIGSGTATLVGGTTSTFASGVGSTDLDATDNSAWNSTTYATTAPNKSAGVQFMAGTSGYEAISVSFDLRKSNTASRFLQFQYSTDGTTWLDFGSALDQNLGTVWFNNNSFDLSGISAVNDNANFGVRIVAAWNGSNVYEAAQPGSTFGSAGTIRYDMVTVNGTQIVPEPTTMAAFGLGALALLRRRKR